MSVTPTASIRFSGKCLASGRYAPPAISSISPMKAKTRKLSLSVILKAELVSLASVASKLAKATIDRK